MNLREMIGEYAMWCRRFDEVSGWAGEGAERVRRQFCEAENRIKRAAELAEAAVEVCEAVLWMDQISEGLLPSVEYAEAWKNMNEAYRRWVKLRESIHQFGGEKKE